MSWGTYAILVIFGLFVLLLIINPKMSCFGKRIRSPFYPITRKRRLKKKLTDYHFDLGGDAPGKTDRPRGPEPHKGGTKDKDPDKDKKTHDYGFHLD
jgi:hypothetical protein